MEMGKSKEKQNVIQQWLRRLNLVLMRRRSSGGKRDWPWKVILIEPGHGKESLLRRALTSPCFSVAAGHSH